MQGKPQKEQAVRIYLPESGDVLDAQQLENLIWIKDGYVNYLQGLITGESAARSLRILQEWLPVRESRQEGFDWREALGGAEEVIYLDKIVSVRQIDKMQFGNSRLFARRLRLG